MSLTDLASIGSFISGIAVLISLIYLALQVRQNTSAQRATAHQHVQTFMRQHQKMLMDPSLANIFLRGLNLQEGMTEVELIQFHAMVRDWLSFHEESKWLAARKMLDEESMILADQSLRVMLRYPGFRAAWGLSKSFIGKNTRDFVAAETAAALSKGLPSTYVESWRSAIASGNVASAKVTP
jgi:hypothetical protein